MASCAGARLVLLVAVLSLPCTYALRDSFEVDQILDVEEGPALAGADLSSHAEGEVGQAEAGPFIKGQKVWALAKLRVDGKKGQDIEELCAATVKEVKRNGAVTVAFDGAQSVRSRVGGKEFVTETRTFAKKDAEDAAKLKAMDAEDKQKLKGHKSGKELDAKFQADDAHRRQLEEFKKRASQTDYTGGLSQRVLMPWAKPLKK
jgi:hypothetical protein